MIDPHAASPDHDSVSEPLSWDEVHRRYPDQWLVLVETDWIPNDFRFRTARVVGHGLRRQAVLAGAKHIVARYQGFGCFFTGRTSLPISPYLEPLAP